MANISQPENKKKQSSNNSPSLQSKGFNDDFLNFDLLGDVNIANKGGDDYKKGNNKKKDTFFD